MSSDLLILYDDAVCNAASITATSTAAGTTSVNNLSNDIKGKIHRAGYAGSVMYSLTWASNQTIGAVALPMTNASQYATVTVSLYNDSAFTQLVHTTDPELSFEYTTLDTDTTANEFWTGKYSSGYLILPQNYTGIQGMKVLIQDTRVIDNSRIVAGRAWRPIRYASNGIQLNIEDTSSASRTTSGNVVVDRGPQYKTISFNIQYMDEVDRVELMKVLRKVGSSQNVFVSIFPSETNVLRDDYSIYGRIIKSPITYEFYKLYNYTVNIEGW